MTERERFSAYILEKYNSDGEPLCLNMCLLHQAHSIVIGDK